MSVRSAVYCLTLLTFTVNAGDADYAIARAAMVDEVRFYATLARDSGEGVLNEAVMQVLGYGAMLIVGLLFLLSVQNALIMLAILALLASVLMGITSTTRKPLVVMHLASLAIFIT